MSCSGLRTKLFLIMLFAALMLPLPSFSGKILVVASIKPLCLVAEGIGGNLVSCTYLVNPGMDPHSFEPTLKDAKRIKKADLCIRVGLGFDRWMERVSKGKREIVMAKALGIGKRKNPHIWLDPVFVKRFSEKLSAVMASMVEEKKILRQNLERFEKELNTSIEKLRALSKGLEGKGYIAIHPAWTYFSKRFGLKEELALLETPTGDIPYKRVAMAMKLKRKGVKVLVAEVQERGGLALSLSKKLGLKVIFLDPLAENYNSYPKFILNEGKKLIDALK